MNESFVFYRSFLEAASDLTDEQFGKVMRAIAEYGINGVVPENMDAITKMAFHFARPQIDANARRRSNGEKGGRPAKNKNLTGTEAEPNHNQTETKAEPNANANVNAKGNANDKANENAKANVKANEDVTPDGVEIQRTKPRGRAKKAEANLELLNTIGASYGFSEQMYSGLAEWMKYKAETHNFVYAETGARAFFSQMRDKVAACGEYAVLDLIRLCMGQGWKGIIWEKIGNPRGQPNARNGPIDWDSV